jgi:hypothetical protein
VTTGLRAPNDYLVKKWTALADDGQGTERVAVLQRAALTFQQALTRRCPETEPIVVIEAVGGSPQLKFELHVAATTRSEAQHKADYWIDRALTAKVATGRMRAVRLSPPWGKTVTERDVG